MMKPFLLPMMPRRPMQPADQPYAPDPAMFGSSQANYGQPSLQSQAQPQQGAQLPRIGVPASPQDQALMRSDQPMTPEYANQIYDAYKRVGGGQDVSDNQFVKNSQFGIFPGQDLRASIAKMLMD